VLLDGAPRARTDSRGIARVEADTPPSRIQVRHGSWHIAGGNGAGDLVSLEGVIARATVWMAPEAVR
jgi:hypothetical protein